MTLTERADTLRGFNRFYTRQIGVLQEHLLHADFSLTECRVLYELGAQPAMTSADLCQLLDLNAGYLSRVVGGFEKKGLIVRAPSPTDARASHLQLTEQGRQVLRGLEQASQQEVIAMLQRLPEGQQEQLIQAMKRVQVLLGGGDSSYVLRDPRPGDMGLVVQQGPALHPRVRLEFGVRSAGGRDRCPLSAAF